MFEAFWCNLANSVIQNSCGVFVIPHYFGMSEDFLSSWANLMIKNWYSTFVILHKLGILRNFCALWQFQWFRIHMEHSLILISWIFWGFSVLFKYSVIQNSYGPFVSILLVLSEAFLSPLANFVSQYPRCIRISVIQNSYGAFVIILSYDCLRPFLLFGKLHDSELTWHLCYSTWLGVPEALFCSMAYSSIQNSHGSIVIPHQLDCLRLFSALWQFQLFRIHIAHL